MGSSEIDLFGNEIVQPQSRLRDWTGNKQSAYKIIGASNHSLTERHPEEYYATDPRAVEMLLNLEIFSPRILEPCAGGGHISRVLESHGHEVISRDLYDRGYGESGHDFLKCDERNLDCDIVSNPPYKFAQEFVEKGLEVVALGHKCAWFLKLTFLEGKSRRAMFEKYPPKTVYVSSSRLSCAKNGTEWVASSIAYCWYVWEKGFTGVPVIKWFN